MSTGLRYEPMNMRSASVLVFVALSLAGAVNGQQRDVSRYTRVLLPFHASVQTAEGAWIVDWWIRNDGDRAVDLFPLASRGGFPPAPGFENFVHIAAYPAALPRSTLKSPAGDVIPTLFVPPFVPVKTNAPGAFLYVEDSGRSSVAIGGTLGWWSPGVQPAPASLRAVLATEFLTGRHSLVAVPGVAGARYDLRIYALPETVKTARVTIGVYDTRAWNPSRDDYLVHTRTGNLELPAASLPPCQNSCDVPTSDLAPATLQVIGLFEPPGDQALTSYRTFRVEIEPDSPEMRWWAVLSTMDQTTREVTLYQPSF